MAKLPWASTSLSSGIPQTESAKNEAEILSGKK